MTQEAGDQCYHAERENQHGGSKKKSIRVLTVIPMAPEADLGRAKTSSRTSSGSVSLMMEGGEKRRLESPARDLLWGHTGTGGQRRL